jgi:hypothetical protein
MYQFESWENQVKAKKLAQAIAEEMDAETADDADTAAPAAVVPPPLPRPSSLPPYAPDFAPMSLGMHIGEGLLVIVGFFGVFSTFVPGGSGVPAVLAWSALFLAATIRSVGRSIATTIVVELRRPAEKEE